MDIQGRLLVGYGCARAFNANQCFVSIPTHGLLFDFLISYLIVLISYVYGLYVQIFIFVLILCYFMLLYCIKVARNIY